MNPPILFFFFKVVLAILGPLMLNRLLKNHFPLVSVIRIYLLAEASEAGLHMFQTTTRSGLLCLLQLYLVSLKRFLQPLELELVDSNSCCVPCKGGDLILRPALVVF